jgi:hypothetical protein
MVAKLNSKTHLQKRFLVFFQPFRPRLSSKFEKMQCGNQKNAEFDSDFESVEKTAKNLMRKSYQRKIYRKMEFLLLLLRTKVFSL